MKEEENNGFDRNTDDLISRYEEMLYEGKNYYFDVEDLEFILDFYIDMNQMGKAKKAAQYAFNLHPEALPLQIKKAKILLKNNNPKRALSTLEDVQGIEMANTELYQIKGHAYVLLDDISSAKVQYNQAISLIQEKEELVDTLYSISQTLQFQNHYNLAIDYLKQAHSQEDDYLFVLYDLAYCYEQINNFKQSLIHYEKYLDKDPFSDHVWFTVGRLSEEMGDTEKAIEAYSFVHAINPKFSDVLLELARIFEENFLYEKAITKYKEYLELEPESYEVNSYLGNCYNMLDRYDEALMYYQSSIDIEPFNSDVFYGMASVYFKRNQLKDALFYAKRAILIHEDDDKYYALYGKISSKLGNSEDALRSFRQAVDLKPQLVYYWILLSDELIRQNEFAYSIRALQESMEFHDNSAAILFRLSALQYKKGNINLSLQNFKKALVLDRKNYHVFFNIAPEAKASKAINKILTEQTIKK